MKMRTAIAVTLAALVPAAVVAQTGTPVPIAALAAQVAALIKASNWSGADVSAAVVRPTGAGGTQSLADIAATANSGGSGAVAAQSTANAALATANAAMPKSGGTFTGSISATIGGGAINATPIGATTAATGRFSTITSTGTASLAGTVTLAGNTQVETNAFYNNNVGRVVSSQFTNGNYAVRALPGDGSKPLASFFGFSDALSGVPSSAGTGLGSIKTTSDTLGTSVTGLMLDLNSGGAGTKGNRVGLYSSMHFAGTNGFRATPGLYSPLWAYIWATGDVGGTAESPNGQMWGGIASGLLGVNATHWIYDIGFETDFGDASGTAVYLQGSKVVLQTNARPSVSGSDYYFSAVNGQSPVGLSTVLALGSIDGWWPLDSTNANSAVIRWNPPNGSFAATYGPGPAPEAGYLIDLPYAWFGKAVLRTPGRTIAGDGTDTIGPSTISWSQTGLAVSLSGQVGALSAIATTGIGYVAGQHLLDAAGGLWRATAVDGSGGLTAVEMLSAPSVTSGAPPSNPVALTTTDMTGTALGANATLTLTWTAAGTLALGAGATVDNSGTISAAGFKLAQTTPASPGAACAAGTIAADASFVYVCTATNAWKRAALASW